MNISFFQENCHRINTNVPHFSYNLFTNKNIYFGKTTLHNIYKWKQGKNMIFRKKNFCWHNFVLVSFSKKKIKLCKIVCLCVHSCDKHTYVYFQNMKMSGKNSLRDRCVADVACMASRRPFVTLIHPCLSLLKTKYTHTYVLYIFYIKVCH